MSDNNNIENSDISNNEIVFNDGNNENVIEESNKKRVYNKRSYKKKAKNNNVNSDVINESANNETVNEKKETTKGKIPERNKIKPVIYEFLKWYFENIASDKLAPLLNYNSLIKYYAEETGNKVSYTSVKRYIDGFKYVDGRLYSKVDGCELVKGGVLKKRVKKEG